MPIGVMRIFLAAFWLVIAFGIYFRKWVTDAAWADDANIDLAAALAVALAIWNIVRFVTLRQPRPSNEEPIPPHHVDRREEYNPEFDFSKQPTNPPSSDR